MANQKGQSTIDEIQEDIINIVKYPFQKFFRMESSSGILLLLCAVFALIMANSQWSSGYFAFWETHIKIGVEGFVLDKSLLHWINDGLMAIFFFFVGLEIKREIMVGELSKIRIASLPLGAAIGGMLAPALVFIFFTSGSPGQDGWGIPMATDIAFALGILSLHGNRVSLPLKIFLTALAIVDDLGAVLVIAIFYSSEINLIALGAGGSILAALFLLNALKIRHPFYYAILGIFLWVAFLKSGMHTTVAGVLLALTIPAHTKINRDDYIRKVKYFFKKFIHSCEKGSSLLTNQEQQEAVQSIEHACHEVESPMQRLEHDLQPWVIYFIMPVFALANAGTSFDTEIMSNADSNLTLGVMAGLVLGKPLGILLFSFLMVKLGFADLPRKTNWNHIIGLGFLAGIGFTMSLFINSLAFEGTSMLAMSKFGILAASLLAGIIGYTWLHFTLPRNNAPKS
ncbi:MAG: Na+/H+ antiporter NhaA [Bacteroidales bacterium]|nr:Na+/H+ antiporter NhaA [Bacteroidales bacterium]MCF8388277.1 Na+/H+ antiporter NhaA [Bacteroidales bacterium]MCF8399125.1 Na+/H+ antiporter NhaA [Bacteroidales bacterium]